MDVSNHPIDFESMLKFSAEFSGDPIRGMSVLEKQFGLLQINNVYHYTDISGFISIMENHELWASHIAFIKETESGSGASANGAIHRGPTGHCNMEQTM